MKKSSLYLLTIISLLCFISCSRDDYPELKDSKSIFTVSVIKNLSYYADFKMVQEKQLQYLLDFDRDKHFSFDQEYFSYLLSTANLTSDESAELNNILNHLGFACIREFYEYDAVISKFAAEIVRETNFLENDPEKNHYEIEKIFDTSYSSPEKSCLGVFSSCVNSAQAYYTMNILLCAGGAIGVGAATVGWGGVIFQLVCSGTAYWKFSTDLDLCLASYEIC